MKSTGIGDTVYFGPEAEFFIFDDVRFSTDPYNTGFTLDSIEAAVQHRHRVRERQPRPPLAHQGRLLPGAAGRQRAGHARRDAGGDGRDGRRRRKAPPRSGLGPARARHQVRHADHDGRQHADLQVRASTRSRTPTARPRPSCRSRSIGDNGSGMHVPPVDLEGRQAAVRRRRVCRPVGDVPLLHRRHHQARQGDQRLHQPDDQHLQAPGAGLRSAGAARLFGAQPLGLVPHPASASRRRPSASKSASPIRWPTPISPSPRC